MDDEDTPVSSLQPVHKLSRSDPLHDLQLLRDVAIINERTERELGPRPRQPMSPEPKRKPNLKPITRSPEDQPQEYEDMKSASFAMIAALGLSAVQPIAAHGMVANEKAAIPEDVLDAIGKDQTVIAYQSISGTKERAETIALVSRVQTAGPVSPESDPEWNAQFSCALVVLERSDDGVSITGRSTGAVNCESNLANRRAGFRNLDDNLELSPGKVTFTNYSNTGPGGWYSYTFSLDGKKWLVTSGKAMYHFNETDAEDNLILNIEEASSPKDFKAVPMGDLDPEWMADMLARHRKKVKA